MFWLSLLILKKICPKTQPQKRISRVSARTPNCFPPFFSQTEIIAISSWRLSQYIMASFDDFEDKFSKIIPSNLISLTKFPFLFASSSFISRQRRSEIICKLNRRDNSCKSECHLSNNQVRKNTDEKISSFWWILHCAGFIESFPGEYVR